jgi:hypothetical protein
VESAEDLYGLDLADFVAARNALAARLKAAGDADTAASVKALRKPPTSAWALNVLAREQPELIEQVLDAANAVVASINDCATRCAPRRPPTRRRSARSSTRRRPALARRVTRSSACATPCSPQAPTRKVRWRRRRARERERLQQQLERAEQRAGRLADVADAAEAAALEARALADAAHHDVQQLREQLDELDGEHR